MLSNPTTQNSRPNSRVADRAGASNSLEADPASGFCKEQQGGTCELEERVGGCANGVRGRFFTLDDPLPMVPTYEVMSF